MPELSKSDKPPDLREGGSEQPRFTSEQVEKAESQIVESSKKIEFFITDFSVELLANKFDNGEFEIPDYQREDTWEPERKSRFLESLIIGLPIPFLFFYEQPKTGKLEIVDGSQRLRTIHQFVIGEFALGELEVLTEIEGMRFCDLPVPRQRKIKNRPIRGIILNEHADEQARFEIFDRINTGSKIANKAEVRRGALIGPFLDLVISLTNDENFANLAPFPDQSIRLRAREELVTRFFAYGDGLEGYRDRPSEFLFSYAKKMNSHFVENPGEVEKYRQRFLSTMDFVKRVFPFGFKRKADGTTTPKARFEAIAIGSYLSLKAKPALARQKIDISAWFDKPDFTAITRSDSANPIKKLSGRLHFVRDRLLGVNS